MAFAQSRRVPTIVNVICFIIAVVVSAIFLLRPLSAVHRGFFCDDENIRYPYEKETISVPVLIISSYLPAVLLVFTQETLYGILTTKIRSGLDGSTDDKSKCEGLKTGLGRAGLLFACLSYGNLLCYMVTEIFKLSFGRLRPCFLSACQPEVDVTSFPNCSGSYIQEIKCMNTDTDLVQDMRKSFVSGHASMAVFNMLYIILYLQLRLPSSTPRLVVSLLQSVAMGYGVFVCATRVLDNYHHPEDVLGGAILGSLAAWVTIFKISPCFIRHPPRAELDTLPTTQHNTKQGSVLAPTSIQTKE